MQILLTMLGIIWFGLHFQDDNALLAYCFVIGGNLVSCLIHIALRYNQAEGSPRSKYQKNMFLILVIGAACWVFGDLFKFYIHGFLIVFPITAGIYIGICLEESDVFFKITDHEE